MEDLRWRVGSGYSISIFEDAWLPGSAHQKVESIRDILGESKVVDLIAENRRKWKEDIMYTYFSKAEADKIINIPPSIEKPR